ncbi:hypothetical protein ACIBJE_26030 [Micromonospora sp. NPDC050187]|uniref:hypothetical protein n=1 Tax=Micromonospora sp. NPDC050187 TaxID=3364277 RepID=UPI0037979A28
MKPFRVVSAVLICASLTLAGCGGGEDSTAESAPSVSSAPSSPAASDSSAPSPSAAAGGASDKELCESAKKFGNDMKTSLVTALQADQAAAPAAFRKILTELDVKMTALAATGGDTPVTVAIRQFGVEAAKAAKAADPAAAAANPTFEKVGTDLTTACKKAGVDVNF